MKRDDPAAGLLVLIERLSAQVETLVKHEGEIIAALADVKARVHVLEAQMALLQPIGR